MLFVHGPGGIGKSSLLGILAELATGAGAEVVRIDGRAIAAVPDSLLGALSPSLLVSKEDSSACASRRVVVLIDSYERLASMDDWIRTDLLPRLPASSLVVMAGRHPPGTEWRSDPAWRALLRIISLRNLNPDVSRRFLTLSGVHSSHHDRIIEVSHGHPLALSLLADLSIRGGDVMFAPLPPAVVSALLRRFVEVIPSPDHRRALEVCALARVTTEALLREALGIDDAGDLFEWLRALSFVETGPHGLSPHDLARDVLDVDLRWRDPETYKAVFRSVRAHIHRRLHDLSGREQQRAIFDEKFVFRNLPSVLSPVDWQAWGETLPEPAVPGDRDPILAMVMEAEGPASAAVAEQWWARQPDGFFVVRDSAGVRGLLVLITLEEGDDLNFDLGARTAWDHAQRMAPARPGEVVTQSRFIIDRHCYQAPSPTLNATPVLTMQRYLQTPNLAWDFLTLAEPDSLDAYFALADLPRVTGADFVVGERRYGLFAHDFRRVPVDVWLEVVTERALAQDPMVRPDPVEELHVLSRNEFAGAVRRGLRDLMRPDRLEHNPLARTRLVLDYDQGQRPTGAALAELIRSAALTLGADPRDAKLWHALERTYLKPAETQERAAEVLDLPFSTYRRHLGGGVERVIDLLWDREVHGCQGASHSPTPASTIRG